MMTTNDKPDPSITPEAAVEIDEAQLDQAAGGAVYIKFDGVDGESKIQKVPGLKTRP
jgi:hypothetical protein